MLGLLAPRSATMILLSLSFLHTEAQTHKCGSERLRNIRASKDPHYLSKLHQAEESFQRQHNQSSHKKDNHLITIPVVVHVLYHNNKENISDQQIQSQIDVLNTDFQHKNADSLKPSHPFYQFTSNTEIEFCLANTDPDGNTTTGITRTKTDSLKFFGVGNEKFSSSGGIDNWDPKKYLNIWVCHLDEDAELLGYASFPTDLGDYPEEDGVVIDYRAFGTTGTAGTDGFEDNDGGRTATHEVGHWLYLEHIWGDDDCGSDGVSDTPPQEMDNSGCPTFPHNANNKCGSNENGEMFMNYMDYVDDHCMVMFTTGQKARMRDAIESWRADLLKSTACSNSSNVQKAFASQLAINAFPNPTNGQTSVELVGAKGGDVTFRLSNSIGQTVKTWTVKNVSESQVQHHDFSSLTDGVYFLNAQHQGQYLSEKFIIRK